LGKFSHLSHTVMIILNARAVCHDRQ